MFGEGPSLFWRVLKHSPLISFIDLFLFGGVGPRRQNVGRSLDADSLDGDNAAGTVSVWAACFMFVHMMLLLYIWLGLRNMCFILCFFFGISFRMGAIR